MRRTPGMAAAVVTLVLASACGGGGTPEGVYDLTFDLVPADVEGRLILPGGRAGGGLLMVLANPPRQMGASAVSMTGDTLVVAFAQGPVLRLVQTGDSVHGYYRPTPVDTAFVRGVRSSEEPDASVRAALSVAPQAAGTLSVAEQHDAFPVFAGEELLFTRSSPDWRRHVLVSASPSGDGWTPPAALPFSGGGWNDRGATFLPADSLLVFSSDRPLPGDSAGTGWNLWQVARTAGGWGDPAPLAINSDSADFHPSADGAGHLYFASRRTGGAGAADIWVAPRTADGWDAPINLGGGINTHLSEGSVTVDPAGRWLLVTITERPGGFGNDDFWLAEREGERWGELRNPGAPLNSFDADYGAALDPDGRRLWFSSHRRGFSDLYAVPLTRLGIGGS